MILFDDHDCGPKSLRKKEEFIVLPEIVLVGSVISAIFLLVVFFLLGGFV